MSHSHSPSVSGHRLRAHARTVAALLIVAIGMVLASSLGSSYYSTIEREQTNLRNLAAAFAPETHYATLALDITMARDAERALRDPKIAHSSLVGTVRDDMPTQVYVLAPDGRLRVAFPALPAGARLPVPVLSQGNGPQVSISELDPDSGRGAITLVRRLPAAAGMPAGAVLIRTDASYFQHIFDASDLGRGGSVTLLRRDGIMLVRSPRLQNAIGHSFRNTPLFQLYLPRSPAGAFEATSPVDGKRRLYGYSEVTGYPLVIITSRDKSDVMVVWYRWLWIALLAWALLSGTLATLAWRIGRETARQAALIARLSASENRLIHSFHYLKSIIDSLATPLWVLDAQRRIVLFNKAFRQFIGQDEQTLNGRVEAEVFDPAGAQTRERLYTTIDGDGIHKLEVEVLDGMDKPRTVIQLAARLQSEDNAAQIVNSITDITERKQIELRLAYLSDYDPLTDLPNHNQLRRVLGEAIQAAAARDEQVALLLVALERLQEVADLLGHEAGDDAVRQITTRLGKLTSQTLCTARVKANEFGLVLPALMVRLRLDAFALELHALLSEPVKVCNREFHLEPVIGIALYPQDTGSGNELIRLADIAKHRARSESGEPVHFHSESTHAQLNERLSIEEQLRRALERGELAPVYQPKVDIATGKVVGFEVLLRWRSPVLGPVSPTRFIPIAEQSGLIVPIGNWVLRAACTHASAWRREHGIQTKVAVNLSIRQFYQRDLLRSIDDALASSGLPPEALELEITESIAMSRADVVERLLGGIRQLGVELSIDDFGTGYSSLAYLRRFPVQRLKIDRAFVHDLGRDADSAAIVRSIVALGHGLHMHIVAEGVETAVQLDMLRALGCDEYQGFLFARAVDATAVPALLWMVP